jgi:hypothetical protein
MKVEAASDRKINEAGNQVLTVTGVVRSDTQQGVLPAGKDYEIAGADFKVQNGELHFVFSVEAKEGDALAAVAKLPSELTPQEQEEAFLKSQLADPNLDETSRSNIEQKLGTGGAPEVVPATIPAQEEAENPSASV